MEVDLPFNDGVVAAGLANVRYVGTQQWLHLGYHVIEDGNQFATVFCRSLGYGNGQASDIFVINLITVELHSLSNSRDKPKSI